MKSSALLLCILSALASKAAMAALNVINPPAGSNSIAAGVDFATEQFGNPWDMSDAADVRLRGSYTQQLTAPTLGSGVLSATSNNVDPWFYAYFGGFISSVPSSVEARHTIDTARYRFLTTKIRFRAAGGGVLGAAQPVVIYFLRDTSYGPGSFNNAPPIGVASDSWQIVTVDLNSGGAPNWQSFPKIGSLRFDPTVNANVLFDIDWIRLTAPPGGSTTSYTVTWTDTGSGPYTLTAIDSGGARYTLASNVNGNSLAADFSRLIPGDYQVEVARSGATALSPGLVHIDAPPLLGEQAPSIRGDQARNFAKVLTGNPWGPMDAADVTSAFNVTNVSYSNPVGSLGARPTNNDPYVFFNLHGLSIDASLYRSLCFTEEVFGTQAVGAGSVTRLLWGNTTLSTSDDFVVDEGTNEYCVADMATLPTEPSTPGTWSGLIPKLRIDPHEFPVSTACSNSPSPANCRDFRIDSVVVSPFFTASPDFTFRWSLTDVDSINFLVQVYLDPDLNPGNGNEILAGTTSATNGIGQLSWYAPAGLPLGNYNVRFAATDGVNVNTYYAEGPLRVAATAAADTIFRNGFD